MSVLLADGITHLLTVFVKSSAKLVKASAFLSRLKWYIIEILFVRVFFVCLANLESYFKSGA